MTLTINILTRNNEKSLEKCLESLSPLDANILIGDMESTDNTVEICSDFGCTVKNIKFKNDYSKARNELVEYSETDWQFWIEPWETLTSGHDFILWALDESSLIYNVYQVQKNVLVRQSRLWNKNYFKFQNPVYESLEPVTSCTTLNAVVSGDNPNRTEETLEILKSWMNNNPHDSNVYYYTAITYLMTEKWNEFISQADQFLFRSKNSTDATLLTNYYWSIVQLHVKKNPSQALSRCAHCLSQMPTMAEFWCLLGDIFVSMNQYIRATAFYENAMVFGSRRAPNDSLPIEIAKYKEYPEKMLEKIKTKLQVR
jgi:glycosyltransferase involved in cell wall biosynthesis